jgi:hypothetical protein
MGLQIFDCEQGSDEWFACRLGIPTASMFSTVMASGKGGGPSLTRAKYMRELAAERITGEPDPGYSNLHMVRGKELEAKARRLYAFVQDVDPVQVGFIRNGDKGCSPDTLIGAVGMNEIKTALPHILADILLRDHAPPEHTAQLQGGLWVSEREWIDLAIFWPKMPLFVKRFYRDEAYIEGLAMAVDQFNDELAGMTERLRRMSVAA